MHRILIKIVILAGFILFILSYQLNAKILQAYVSKDGVTILRMHNTSANTIKVKFSILSNEKEVYASEMFSITKQENSYFSLNELLTKKLDESKEGLPVKINIQSSDIEKLENQLITMSIEAGVLISAEQKKSTPPVIKKVAPAKATLSGGTLITIFGSDFDESAVVRIDGVESLRLRENENRIIAIAPAHEAGKVDIEVENPGKRSATMKSALEYSMPPPVLLSLIPNSSSQDGNAVVELNGQNFNPNCKVMFGSVPATSVKFINESKLQVMVPPHKPGEVDVRVINAEGLESALRNAFKYRGYPYLRSISPNMGLPDGSTLVTINGENFEEDCAVLFDGLAAQINFAKPNLISVLSPPHSSGYVTIEIRNANNLSTTLNNAFLYNSPPKIVEAYAYPNPCLKRSRIKLVVSAVDPENQPLSFQWNVAEGVGGTLVGNDNEVAFECPNVSGQTIISVVVFDQFNASVKTSITVNVQ